MDDYVDVAERIRQFRDLHPDGSLQPADPIRPYLVETIGEQTFIAVVAAAYRSPEDVRPGIGMAYEPFPGRTPFTRGSELQNAETSAWGRAIVAALAADTKKIASAEEVRNRSAGQDKPTQSEQPEQPEPSEADKARYRVRQYADESGIEPGDVATHFKEKTEVDIREADAETLDTYLATIKETGISEVPS